MNLLNISAPLVLGCALILGACEKTIPVNIPSPPAKLVLNAVVMRGDSIRAQITRTFSNAESGKNINPAVSGATVVLYRDGVAADTLESMGDGLYVSPVLAEAGHRYKLSVTHPAYPGIEAETAAPEAVPILGWDITQNARSSPNDGDQDLLRIRFRDPAGAGDHYIIQVLGGWYNRLEELDFYSWGDCINIADPSFESPYSSEFPGEDACLPAGALLLRDPLFEGQEKELRLYGGQYLLRPQQSWNGPNDSTILYPRVRMFHVTQEFYRFVKSYRSAQDASGNPFAEPFNLSSNVNGGYGVFAILSADGFEIR